MAKYFFCNKFVNEMFLGCNIKNLFGSREVQYFILCICLLSTWILHTDNCFNISDY